MSIWGAIRRSVNGRLDVPLDVTIGQRADAAATAINNTHTIVSYMKGAFNRITTLFNAHLGNGVRAAAVRSIQKVSAAQIFQDNLDLVGGTTISPVDVSRAVIIVEATATGSDPSRSFQFLGNNRVGFRIVAGDGVFLPALPVTVIEFW